MNNRSGPFGISSGFELGDIITDALFFTESIKEIDDFKKAAIGMSYFIYTFMGVVVLLAILAKIYKKKTSC